MPPFQTSPGLIWVTHFSEPSRASMAMAEQAYLVSSRGSSLVGCRGALLVSVPKKMVREAVSYDGVDQTVLVAGPNWKTWSPQASLITTGGSRRSGFGPTSYFQMTRPDCGSRAMRKPRPVKPSYLGRNSRIPCSKAPPATTILPSARMGEENVPFNGCESGNAFERMSTRHFSLP